MNWKSTLALLLLAGGAGAWYFMGHEWGPKIGIETAQPEAPPSPATQLLGTFSPGAISQVKIDFPAGDPIDLKRATNDVGWEMPGKWPPRKAETEELVAALGNLRTRFVSGAVPKTADLSPFGLADHQKPLLVKVTVNETEYWLQFGQPPLAEGETEFTRTTFLRIGKLEKVLKPGPDVRPPADTNSPSVTWLEEVLKLGPDVLRVVGRPAETYRRRAIFSDVERVRVVSAAGPFAPPGGETAATVSLPGTTTETITIHRPDLPVRVFGFTVASVPGSSTLTRQGALPEAGVLTARAEPALPPERLADAWRLTAPVPDHADPGALRGVLVAVGDLWMDRFVKPADAKFALDSQFAIALGMPSLFESPFAAAARHLPEAAFLEPIREKIPLDVRTGLAGSPLAVTVKRQGADAVTVRFGGIARVSEREEVITVPGPMGRPQAFPRTVVTEYRYAQLDGSTQVFVAPADKYRDLFVSPDELADARVARFNSDEVQRFTISRAGQPDLTFFRVKGNRKATEPEEQLDRWFIETKTNPLLADTGRVTEIVNRLAGLRADQNDRRQYFDELLRSGMQIIVTARETRAENEAAAPNRTYTFNIGTPVGKDRTLPVWLDGSRRVSQVDDRLGPPPLDSWIAAELFPELFSDQLGRSAIAYRDRRLFDRADKLQSVSVPGQFTLTQENGIWKLTALFPSEADEGAAGRLAFSLAGLTATDLLTDKPTPEQIKAFGFEKPQHTATLQFTSGRKYTLDIGAPRPGKAEVFARLDDGGAFALPNTATEPFTSGALGLLPLQVWNVAPEKVVGLEVTRTADAAKDSFTLLKGDPDWRLLGSVGAPVPAANVQSLATSLGRLTAVKYHALSVMNDMQAAELGLDKPFLVLQITFDEKKPNTDEDVRVTKRLLVGNPGLEPNTRYAKLEGPNSPVFLVRGSFVTAAQIAPLELLDRKLLAVAPGLITKMSVSGAKPEDSFALAYEGGKWLAEGTTFAVDAERIKKLLEAAGTPQVTRIAAFGDGVKWADYGLETPISIVGVTESGKPHTIALGNIDPTGARFARIDGGKAVAVLSPDTVAALARKRFEYADRTLLRFDPTTLVGFSRKAGKDELELAPAAAVGWDIVKPAKIKADAQFIEELAETLSRLQAERVAAYGKKDDVFKQHGLEPPVAAITLTVGEKAETKTLRIGNPVDAAKPDGERYATVEGASPEVIVGVLSANVANRLLGPAVSFREHTLGKFVDADKAVLERGDRKATFAKVGVTWKLTEPVAAIAEAGELEALVADLGKLRADTWVAEKGKDLKPFGLDPPEAKWTIFDGDKPVLVLLIGKKTADGRVHVTTDKGELVGLLDLGTSGRVLAEYRLRRPWDVDAAQIATIDVAAGSSKFTLLKAGMAWIDTEKPGDIIDVRAVNELLGTLGALKVERFAADKDGDRKLFGLEKPEATITVSQGAEKRTIEIGGVVGGTEGKQRYARIADKDRTDVFVLSATDTARLTRDRGVYVLKK